MLFKYTLSWNIQYINILPIESQSLNKKKITPASNPQYKHTYRMCFPWFIFLCQHRAKDRGGKERGDRVTRGKWKSVSKHVPSLLRFAGCFLLSPLAAKWWSIPLFSTSPPFFSTSQSSSFYTSWVFFPYTSLYNSYRTEVILYIPFCHILSNANLSQGLHFAWSN